MSRKYTINEEERKRRSERMKALNEQADLSTRAKKTNAVRKQNREQLQERLRRANELLQAQGLDTVW